MKEIKMPYSSKIYLIILIFVLLGADIFAESESKFEQDYKVLMQKNIFSKNRFVESFRSSDLQQNQQQTSAASQIRYVLRGIASVNNQKVAFFEDITTGLCTITHVGDDFENGKIKDISAKSLVYEIDDQQRNIQIGADLAGSSYSSSNETTKSYTTTPVESDENNEILKKLMEKRKKELGQN